MDITQGGITQKKYNTFRPPGSNPRSSECKARALPLGHLIRTFFPLAAKMDFMVKWQVTVERRLVRLPCAPIFLHLSNYYFFHFSPQRSFRHPNQKYIYNKSICPTTS